MNNNNIIIRHESEVPYFLGQELKEGYLAEGFEAYESSFPAKEKLVLPGQLQ